MEAPKLSDFAMRSLDKLRYGDTDRQGHINNAVFSTFLETGRCDLLNQIFGTAWRNSGTSFVIARLEIDYRAEILWPGQVDIGTSVLKIGNSSLRLSQAIFQGTTLNAMAETVLVYLGQDKRPTALPDEIKQKLSALLRPSA